VDQSGRQKDVMCRQRRFEEEEKGDELEQAASKMNGGACFVAV
jgi:hypothetical protein